MILRTFAAVTTVLAASLVAAKLNARVTVAGFLQGTQEVSANISVQRGAGRLREKEF